MFLASTGCCHSREQHTIATLQVGGSSNSSSNARIASVCGACASRESGATPEVPAQLISVTEILSNEVSAVFELTGL